MAPDRYALPAAPPVPESPRVTSLQGRLEDLSVGELLQVINYASVTGTLHIEDDAGAHVSLTFADGKLVAATSPVPGETVGSLLVDSGRVSAEQMAGALAAQTGPPRRYLGEVLLAQGLITRAELDSAILQHFKRVLAPLLRWSSGSFQVLKGPPAPSDELAWFPEPASIAPYVDLPKPLLEVTSTFDDEVHHDTESDTLAIAPAASDAPAHTTVTPAPVELVDPVLDEVVVLTERPEFLDLVDTALGSGLTLRYAEYAQPLPRSILDLHRHRGAAVFVVDGALSQLCAAVGALRAAAPLVPVLVILREGPAPCPVAELWRQGARVLSPAQIAEGHGVRAVIAGCLQEAREIDRRMRRAGSDLQAILDGLRSLRRGADHASILSTVLRLFTEQMSRVVLFVHRRHRLVAVAARGDHLEGGPELSTAIGCRVELDRAPWAETVVDNALPWANHVGRDPALAPLLDVIGAPAMDEGILIPIRSLDRVVAILYGDNGEKAVPLGTMLNLEILALQAGLLFETIALHRHEDAAQDEAGGSAAEDLL